MKKAITIVSWNVNSINARLERATAFLRRLEPDIVCLQELKCVEEKFPKEAMAELGYHVAIAGQKTYNGVAILSKEPISNVQAGFGDDTFDHEARFIHANTFGMDVMSAYIPNGQEVGAPKYLYKLKWLKRLSAYLQAAFPGGDKRPYALCGDFNVAMEDQDVYSPEEVAGCLLFTVPERKALKKLMDENQLVDTFRRHCSEAGKYSWWDYRALGFQMGKGLRIDYVFTNHAATELCESAWIERDERKGPKPSDHAPVFAKLRHP